MLAVAFINKNNFADVRKLELVNKRFLVSDGVFGVSDAVIGGFTDDLNAAVSEFAKKARTKEQIQSDYLAALDEHHQENKQLVSDAEEILFTTFTRELANKVKDHAAVRGRKSQRYQQQAVGACQVFF